MGFFGSMLAGAAGGAAKGWRESIDDQEKLAAEERRLAQEEARAVRDDGRALSRLKAQTVYAQEVADESATKKRKQLSMEMSEAQKGAESIRQARDMARLEAVSARVPQAEGAPRLTLADVETIRNNMSPEDAQKHYGIAPQTQLSSIDDQLMAARQQGGYAAVDALGGARKDVLTAMDARRKDDKEARTELYQMGMLKETQRGNDIRDKNADTQAKRLDAMINKIASGGGSTSSKYEKVTTFLEGLRRLLTDESKQLQSALTDELKAVEYYPEKQDAIRANYKAAQDSLAKRLKQLNDDYSEVRSRFGLSGTDEPAPKASNRPPLSSFQK